MHLQTQTCGKYIHVVLRVNIFTFTCVWDTGWMDKVGMGWVGVVWFVSCKGNEM